MKKSPAFQFYAADFLADEKVALMNNRELGCYIKLMCYCWREGSIPADPDKIARLCGEDDAAMAQLWPAIGACFTAHDTQADRLTHKRLDAERSKQAAFHANRSEAGRKGAASRWHKGDGAAITEPMANDAFTSSSSSKKKKEKKPAIGFDRQARAFTHLDDDTLAFWTATYPQADVPQQLLQAAAWLDANPHRMPKNVKRFLANWLNSTSKIKPVNGAAHAKPTRAEAREARAAALTGRDRRQASAAQVFPAAAD